MLFLMDIMHLLSVVLEKLSQRKSVAYQAVESTVPNKAPYFINMKCIPSFLSFLNASVGESEEKD